MVKNNLLNMFGIKKGELTTQTFFYIMMSIFMVAIVVFGIQKIFLVENILSEQERVEVINNIKKGFDACEDPLNKGNFELVEVENNAFNSICFLTDDSSDIYLDFDELNIIRDSGDNVVLINSEFLKGVSGFESKSFEIISSFKIESKIENSFCEFDYENSGNLNFELEC